jgi:UDP-N-acetylglucosamine diphosphorylase / glucose-1-phosphate thymidylyltransferase / UDP-N-acetylgalactosamine diphosphorylase / glucosamine-1-phosphate N-acetyltransferase / galactosamine-1-phosphate N-acetyltransferase
VTVEQTITRALRRPDNGAKPMRLILFDQDGTHRKHFWPLALSRPIWELRCGMTTLGEKIIQKVGAQDVAYFMPEYLAPVWKQRTEARINDPAALRGDDLLMINARLRPEFIDQIDLKGATRLGRADHGEIMYIWLRQGDHMLEDTSSFHAFMDFARVNFPPIHIDPPAWDFSWDLILANSRQIIEDFRLAGRSGIEGKLEQPSAIRGSRKDVYIGRDAVVHPMVVLDAEHGPIYLDEGVEVHPFTRIEGPCFVGKKSILLGTKCREGNSIGPMCRIGGEIEESIIQGYSNKYHDGFLGHAYVGEWVNLGALTTNSDLKNDYGNVEVTLDGRTPIDTGSVKVGALVGDHTKTSICTLLNSGAYVGAMSLVMATGKPLPKHIPDFSWLIEGVVTKGFGKGKLYETAKMAMSRRKMMWTEAEQRMWDTVYEMTAAPRDEAIRRGRRQLLAAI